MITSYPFQQGKNLPGTVDGPCDNHLNVSRTNPAKAQTGTLTVGGTASDGVYSASFYHPDEPDNPIVVSFTRAAGETNNQISAALAADAVKKLILKASVSVVNAVSTVAFGNPLITYTVTTSAPGTGTLAWAQTVAAGGVTLPFGRFVIGGDDGLTCLPVTTGVVIASVIGVVERVLTVQQNPDPTADDGFGPGRDVPIFAGGAIAIEVEEDVVPGDTVYIRIVASGLKTKLGVVGKSADGGNCISAASIARFDTAASAGETARVIVHIPLKAA